MGVGGWYSRRLLSLNPTTVMVVLFLGLWLLLACDNNPTTVMVVLLLGCGCCWAVTILILWQILTISKVAILPSSPLKIYVPLEIHR